MTRLLVRRRAKDERAVYAIYPCEGCFIEGEGRLNPEMELGRVKARTASEALKLAVERGIGVNCDVWAIECLSDDRVTVIEE